MLSRLIRRQEGQALVEYSLIAAALILGVVAVATGLSRIQGGLYQTQHRALSQWQSP